MRSVKLPINKMPQHFNPVSGRYVRIAQDSLEARLERQDPWGVGVAFLSLAPAESVKLQMNFSDEKERTVIFGFTTKKPNTLINYVQRDKWKPCLAELKLEKDKTFVVFRETVSDVLFWAAADAAIHQFFGFNSGRLWLFVILQSPGDSVRIIEDESAQAFIKNTIMMNIEPMFFHPNCGKAFEIISTQTVCLGESNTQFSNTMDDRILFSARPIKINDSVCLVVALTKSEVPGARVAIGFTTQDPAFKEKSLSKSEYWITSIKQEKAVSYLCYFVYSGGVYVSIDGKPQTKILSGVFHDEPLWAMIHVLKENTKVTWTNAIHYRHSFTYGALASYTSTSQRRLEDEPSTSRTFASTNTEQRNSVSVDKVLVELARDILKTWDFGKLHAPLLEIYATSPVPAVQELMPVVTSYVIKTRALPYLKPLSTTEQQIQKEILDLTTKIARLLLSLIGRDLPK